MQNEIRKLSGPKILLQLEGVVPVVVAMIAYHKLEASWLTFALLFLVPDVAMVGYVFGSAAGSRIYNAAHTYLAPFLLGIAGYVVPSPALLPLALIWVAHIGIDRSLGYGLKYQTAFKDTHLARV
jgi:hypothetical protein